MDFSDARVIKALPKGLEECQKRMTNPIQRLLTFTKVLLPADILMTYIIRIGAPDMSAKLVWTWQFFTIDNTSFHSVKHAQEAREADACMDEYSKIIMGIVKEMKARGAPQRDDMSVGAQLLRAKDPSTGKSACTTCMYLHPQLHGMSSAGARHHLMSATLATSLLQQQSTVPCSSMYINTLLQVDVQNFSGLSARNASNSNAILGLYSFSGRFELKGSSKQCQLGGRFLKQSGYQH